MDGARQSKCLRLSIDPYQVGAHRLHWLTVAVNPGCERDPS